jgi:4'-phosphopantetheinyl transferase EntD
VIEEILPETAACAEAFADPPGVVLFPEEEALVATAAGRRRREFATARSCARTALAELGVLGIVAVAGEQERLRRLKAAAPGTCWDRLLFSAKESVYKAWFPLTGFAGRWLASGGLILTAVTLAAPPSAACAGPG